MDSYPKLVHAGLGCIAVVRSKEEEVKLKRRVMIENVSFGAGITVIFLIEVIFLSVIIIKAVT